MDLLLGLLCAVTFVGACWNVTRSDRRVFDVRHERGQLLTEFEELRVLTDRVVELEPEVRDQQMDRIRNRVAALALRWRDARPVAESEPRLVRSGSRELLILVEPSELDRQRSGEAR